MRPIPTSFQENQKLESQQTLSATLPESPPPRVSKRAMEQSPTATPSTRLSGLMKRIQAKANDCQTQLESFVNNVSSAVHLGGGNRKVQSVKNCPQGVVIGPVHQPPASPQVRPYLFEPKASQKMANVEKDKNGPPAASKHTYVIKLATLTPATMHSVHRRNQQQQQQQQQIEGPFKTWNAPISNKSRPDLSLVGFRPDKHVTCIEVTLINNQTAPDSPTTSESPSVPDSGTKSGIKTYCFGELPGSVGDKSPTGTISSRGSSRGSEQFDSGFEETAHRSKSSEPVHTPTSTSIIRSIFDKIGGHMEQRTPKVQAKRSTIRREKAFRQRNKYAWSRAKEIQRNDELLQRFHQIRKRLGEEDELEDSGVAVIGTRLSTDDLLCPLPSIVQTLVRQYDTGDSHQRPRDKIVPSRLHSKRSVVTPSANRPAKTNHSTFPADTQVHYKIGLVPRT